VEAGGKTATRPRRGELLEVEIDSLAFGGRGVARVGGYVVFVAGGLPGDLVRAEITKPKKRFAEARTVELLRAGAGRVADRCLHEGEPCPGAPWQGLAYEQQLVEKRRQVDEALRRIGGLDGFELEEIEPALEQWRYRNKLEYSFGPSEGGAALGFHASGRWDLVVDIDDCQLASERGNAARNEVREWAREESIDPYDRRAGAAVVGVDRFLARPLAHLVAGRVASLRGELAIIDVDDQVPASAGMEAECRPALARPEGVFELVTVAPLLQRRLDLLQLEAVEAADPAQRLVDLPALLDQLLLVGEALPWRPRAGLALVQAAIGDAAGAGAQQLDRPRLGEPLLRFGDLGPHQVARQAAGDEDDVAADPGDPAPAEGERVDLDFKQLPAPRPSRGLAARLHLHLSRQLAQFLARAPRRLGRLFAHRRRPPADLFARLFDQPFQLLQQAVGLPAAALDQVGDHLLGVAVGHPAPLDGVVDDLLQPVAAQGDAAIEALAELLDALVEPGGAATGGRFFRRFRLRFAFCFRFRRGRFPSGRFFGARPGFRFFRRFAGRLVFRGHSQLPPVSLRMSGTTILHLRVPGMRRCRFDLTDYVTTVVDGSRNFASTGA